jgi:Tetratricopeptide repeat
MRLYFLLLIFVLILPQMGFGQSQDRYTEAMGKSIALEKAGDIESALAELDDLTESYSQDYKLHMRLGWLRFSLENYKLARASYLRALGLNPNSPDALLGQGWCEYYLDDEDAALVLFEQVLELREDDSSAKEGVAMIRTKRALYPALGLGYTVFTDHPLKASAASVSLAAPFFHGPMFLGITYRFVLFDGGAAFDDDLVSYDNPNFKQHEFFMGAGYSAPKWGITGHFGMINNPSYGEYDVSSFGAELRYSPWGNIFLRPSVGSFDDEEVYRVEAAWASPWLGPLSFTPAASFQYAGDEAFYNLALSSSLALGSVTVSGGGRYGTEYRTSQLNLALISNSIDRIRYGAWAGLHWAAHERFKAGFIYEYQVLKASDQDDLAGTHGFFLTLSTFF